jgi:hypothetical protein
MAEQIVTEYTCDRCFDTKRETEFKRDGAVSLTITRLDDRRKHKTMDLCGNCVDELSTTYLMARSTADVM